MNTSDTQAELAMDTSDTQAELTMDTSDASQTNEQATPARMPAFRIVAASKDVRCSGRPRFWWYRMRWDGTAWRYFAEAALPLGNYRAAQRSATVHGWVSAGDLLLQHDYRGPVTRVYLVRGPDMLEELYWCVKGGRLIVRLPDGQLVDTPCPRK